MTSFEWILLRTEQTPKRVYINSNPNWDNIATLTLLEPKISNHSLYATACLLRLSMPQTEYFKLQVGTTQCVAKRHALHCADSGLPMGYLITICKGNMEISTHDSFANKCLESVK